MHLHIVPEGAYFYAQPSRRFAKHVDLGDKHPHACGRNKDPSVWMRRGGLLTHILYQRVSVAHQLLRDCVSDPLLGKQLSHAAAFIRTYASST